MSFFDSLVTSLQKATAPTNVGARRPGEGAVAAQPAAQVPPRDPSVNVSGPLAPWMQDLFTQNQQIGEKNRTLTEPSEYEKRVNDTAQWTHIKSQNTENSLVPYPRPDKPLWDVLETEPERVLRKSYVADSQGAERTRANRSDILGINPSADAAKAFDINSVKTDRLSNSEYNALTDRQRAAVNENGELYNAVKADLSHQDRYANVSDDKRAAYNKLSEDMFGKDGGSKTYAPETLALLEQLDLKDPAARLDDYLQLKAAITSDDLGALATTANRGRAAIANPEFQDRAGYVNQFADSSEALIERLSQKTESMLGGYGHAASQGRSQEVQNLGGIGKIESAGIGFGEGSGNAHTNAKDIQFQKYYEALAVKGDYVLPDGTKLTDQQVLDDMKKVLPQNELNEFLGYADRRSGNAEDYHLHLGITDKAQYRSPEEFRKVLGLDGIDANHDWIVHNKTGE